MNKDRFLGLVLLIGLSPIGAQATPTTDQPDCKQPGSMAEMTACSQQEFAKADAEMNKVYQQVVTKLNADQEDQSYKKALKASQDAWRRFRDADCDFFNEDRSGGSSQAMNIYGCKTDMTQARTKELEDFLKPLAK